MSEFVYPGLVEQAVQFRNPFTRAREAIADKAHDILRGKPPLPPSEPLTPPSLQYAFEYKSGKLGSQEIGTLINDNFTDLATYSLLKALNTQQSSQQQFLESFVDTVLEHPSDSSALKALQQDTLTRSLPENSSFEGAKVAQIIRQGTNLWKDKFQVVAEEVREDEKERIPVYIAYAGTLGLRQGIDTLRDSGRKMMVLIPDWVAEEDNEYCGYEIDLQREAGERVTAVAKDFERPEEFVFVDDTRRNGMHAQVMWDFWTNNSGEELSESRIRVINFAPKNARV